MKTKKNTGTGWVDDYPNLVLYYGVDVSATLDTEAGPNSFGLAFLSSSDDIREITVKMQELARRPVMVFAIGVPGFGVKVGSTVNGAQTIETTTGYEDMTANITPKLLVDREVFPCKTRRFTVTNILYRASRLMPTENKAYTVYQPMLVVAGSIYQAIALADACFFSYMETVIPRIDDVSFITSSEQHIETNQVDISRHVVNWGIEIFIKSDQFIRQCEREKVQESELIGKGSALTMQGVHHMYLPKEFGYMLNNVPVGYVPPKEWNSTVISLDGMPSRDAMIDKLKAELSGEKELE